MKWTIDLRFRKKKLDLWKFLNLECWALNNGNDAPPYYWSKSLKQKLDFFQMVFNFQVGWPNQQNSVHYALRNKCHHPCANSWIIECTQRLCSTHIAHAGTLELLILGPWMCNVHTNNIVCTSPSEKICEGDKNSGNGLGFKV
jgi:hypothetical protein